MDSFESMEPIAEVAVTLAGFSGLIAALAGASHQGLPQRQRIAFWLVLSTTLLALILSFAPRVLLNFGLEDTACWRTGCALLGLAIAAALVQVLRVHHRLLQARVPSQFGLAYWVVSPLFGAFSLIALLTAVGLLPSNPYAVYYAGLVLLLAQACLVFVLFLFMRTPDGDPPAA